MFCKYNKFLTIHINNWSSVEFVTFIFLSQRRDVCFSEVAKGLARRVVDGPVSTPRLIQLTRVYVSDRDGHYQHLVFAVEMEQMSCVQVL